MKVSRRDFVKYISSASLVLMGGKVLPLTAAEATHLRKNALLRFVVASDGHYGQAETDFDSYHESFVARIKDFHQHNTLDFCVINGDIIHDAPDFLQRAKSHLDKLPVKYYVTKGNHDRVDDQVWNDVWGISANDDVVLGTNTLLLGNTSNITGEFLSPDLAWMKTKLDEHRKQGNIFIFLHIPQAKWTKNGIETPAFFELLNSYKNVRGVFHGHEHDQDGVQVVNKVPFMFDSHLGGNWGTTYRGFRVVEMIKENSFLTYIMNPTEKINQAVF